MHPGAAPWGGGGKWGKSPPKDFKKGENWKNMGYFHASKLLKLAFLSVLTREYVLWKGFYHDFSTKEASALRGLRPLTPTKGFCPLDPCWGRCPLDPRGSFPPPPPPPAIYPGAAPECIIINKNIWDNIMEYNVQMKFVSSFELVWKLNTK